MPFPFDPKSLFDLADKLGVIQSVKNKLMLQPDVAADKLVIVLGELSKIYTACDAELLRYLSLNFNENGDIADERIVLLSLEGGQIMLRANEARGHCHKIWNIYENYLEKWFHKALSGDEAKQMREIFAGLSLGDRNMVYTINALTQWLTDEAQKVLDMVDDGKYPEANLHVKLARKEILPIRQGIMQAMNQLLQLQGEFISVSNID